MGVLADAVLLLRASSIDPGTFTPGDDWPNEGTGGPSLDAVCTGTVDGGSPGTPLLVASPEPGFVMGDGSSGSGGVGPYYYVPHSALLEPGAGSFTFFARVAWPGTSGGFDNVASKIDTTGGAIGSGGTGWQAVDSVFVSGTAGIVSSGGSSPGTDPAFASSGAVMAAGEHLIVVRLDRADDTLAVFVDGVKAAVDASAVAAVTANHELIFARGKEQTGRAYGYWDRALTDDEIALDLPADLGLVPALTVELSPTTDPLEDPSWEDISGYVKAISCRHGRDQALEGQFQPGAGQVTLDNADRRFDPEHAAGPHYGDLVPGKRIRAYATWLGATYDLFSGFADGWPQDYQPPSAADCRVPFTDGLTMLGYAELGATPLVSTIEQLAPTHWWKLDQAQGAPKALDSGSSQVDGIASTAASAGFGNDGIDGSDAKALLLPDEVAYIDVTGVAEWTSFSCWFKTTKSTGNIQSSPGRFVFLAAGKVSAGIDGGAWEQTAAAYNDGQPHFLVVVNTGAGIKIYVDGVLDGTAPGGSPGGFAATAHLLGSRFNYGSTTFQFEGTLQHVAYYAQALSAGDVATLDSADAEFQGQTTGETVESLLDLAGWPAADRDIDTGIITLDGLTQWSDDVLDNIRVIDATEAGGFFQTPGGVMRFRQRYDALTDPRSTTSQATFTDDDTPAALHYEQLGFDEQGSLLRNRVKVSWLDGEVVVADADSIAAYGPREHSIQTVLPTEGEARALANWVLAHYARPILRISKVTLNPAADARLWGPCLGLRVGDRVTVRRWPQQVGDPILSELIVEGVAWELADGVNRATCTVSVSAADTQTYWIWDTSQWGSTTRWG